MYLLNNFINVVTQTTAETTITYAVRTKWRDEDSTISVYIENRINYLFLDDFF